MTSLEWWESSPSGFLAVVFRLVNYHIQIDFDSFLARIWAFWGCQAGSPASPWRLKVTLHESCWFQVIPSDEAAVASSTEAAVDSARSVEGWLHERYLHHLLAHAGDAGAVTLRDGMKTGRNLCFFCKAVFVFPRIRSPADNYSKCCVFWCRVSQD